MRYDVVLVGGRLLKSPVQAGRRRQRGKRRPRRDPRLRPGTCLRPGLHWLKFVDFVPVSDQLIKGKIKDELSESARHQPPCRDDRRQRHPSPHDLGHPVGQRADIIMEINNWPQLYADSVIDVSDIAEEIGQEQGGYYDTAKAVANDGKKWVAMPHTIIPNLLVNRTFWFADIGVTADNFPQTWDAYRDIGKNARMGVVLRGLRFPPR
jgi:multiple sugar transport system substrate-binding protein